MEILNNLENSMDDNLDWCKTGYYEFESTPIEETDNVGRKVWTEGPAVYDSLTVKLFSETCCTNCSCKNV